MRGSAVIGLIAAGLLLAGCGSGTVSGEADAEGTAAGEPDFSPCDDIPADLLNTTGVDASHAERDIDGVKQPGWSLCRWAGPDHSLTVFATTQTVSSIRANARNVDFADRNLDGRDAVLYREASDTRGERCDIAMESGTGSAIVRVSVFHVDSSDPCVLAAESAAALSRAIPE